MSIYLMLDQGGAIQGVYTDIDSALTAVRGHNANVTNPLVNGWYIVGGWQ